MYGGDDSEDQEDKASLEFHDICGFQNIELKKTQIIFFGSKLYV